MSSIDVDARKFLGLPPFDTPSNICWHDAYFDLACSRKHGKEKWEAELRRQREAHEQGRRP